MPSPGCTEGYAPLIVSSIGGECQIVELPPGECLCAPLCDPDQGPTGPPGTGGETGETGVPGDPFWVYQNTYTTTPTAGEFTLVESTGSTPTDFASVDRCYINDTLNGVNMDAWLSRIGDVTNSPLGTLFLYNPYDNTIFASYSVTAYLDTTGEHQYNLTYLQSSETNILDAFPDDTNVCISFESNGNQGTTGSQGTTGGQADRILIYQVVDEGDPTPSQPTGTAVFTWSTGGVANIGLWSVAAPTVGQSQVLYQTGSYQTKTLDVDDTNILTDEWTSPAPTIISRAGPTGPDGGAAGLLEDSTTTDGWANAGGSDNSDGHLALGGGDAGRAPTGGDILVFYPSLNGNSGGWIPKPQQWIPNGAADAFEINSGSFGGGDWREDRKSGATGTAIDTLHMGMTFMATGDGEVLSTKIFYGSSYVTADNLLKGYDITAIGTTAVAPVEGAAWDPGGGAYLLVTNGLSADADIKGGKSIALSGAAIDGGGFLTAKVAGTVDDNGGVYAGPKQVVPHVNSTFMYLNLDADTEVAGGASATSYFGQGVVAGDQTLKRSKNDSDNTYFYTNTAWVDDTVEPYWNVAAVGNGAFYKITVDLIIGFSATNPTFTIQLKKNGTTIKEVAIKSYIVLTPTPISFTHTELIRSAHNLQVYISADVGTATIKSGSSITMERIA